MSNVVTLRPKKEEEEIDIFLWTGTMPPVIVPNSARAKEFFDLPYGAEGIIVEEAPSSLLSRLPTDYLFGTTEKPPKLIVVAKTNSLHNDTPHGSMCVVPLTH